MSGFGVLKKVDLRVLWPKEAGDFTPWLAQNLGELGAILGMDLELLAHEAPVGPFSLDLLVRDLGRDRQVVIENQLEQTDHDHLGKLMTYAAGHDASVIVWIAAEFREQHRQAIDWLNQRTVQHTEFFGVVVEAIQIDDSRPAYNFTIIASPNEWQKTAMTAVSTETSKRGQAYLAYFQDLIDQLREQHQFTRARKGQPQNWYSFSSGIQGVSYGTSFSLGNRIRAEVYIDRRDTFQNNAVFDALYESRSEIEAAFGGPLDWERAGDRQACRIAIYRPGNIEDDPETLEHTKQWAISNLLRLKDVFGPRISTVMATLPPTTIALQNQM